jgi:3-oxoacyl-[acyl-carrier protein] reductase
MFMGNSEEDCLLMVEKYDSMQIGDKAEINHVITQNDIKKFMELIGDDNKLHVDE